ncbi:MAG: hypothetical protein WC180_01425 [Candidatus Paceibacterota bacterium]|jgi:hypothetical protein
MQKKETVESVIERAKFDDPDNPFCQKSAVEHMDKLSVFLFRQNREVITKNEQ